MGKGIQSGRSGLMAIEPLFPLLAALGVAENGIGLVDRLELFFSVGIIAIEIWMPAPCLLTKGALEGLGIGTRLETQDGPMIQG